jgi:hypothetical protein
MSPDGYCFIFGLTIVPFSFLLFPKPYFKQRLVFPFYVAALALAVIGWTMPHSDSTKPNFYLFLLCPIFSLLLLRLELYFFQKHLKRRPQIPFGGDFAGDDDLWWDRVFYFVLLLASVGLPLFILGYEWP